MKKIIAYPLLLLTFLLIAAPSYAHVSVKPNQVGVGAFQTFSVGVPVERDIPTTEIRLVLPRGLQHVTPNVKQGWDIEVKKSGEGETAEATEIIWSGGSIPAGFRDELQFSAQAPAKEGDLQWKAYQTYEDGAVVAWEKDPKVEQPKKDGKADFSKFGPYSQTKIVNDLNGDKSSTQNDNKNDHAFILSIVAIGLAAAALGSQLYNKK